MGHNPTPPSGSVGPLLVHPAWGRRGCSSSTPSCSFTHQLVKPVTSSCCAAAGTVCPMYCPLLWQPPPRCLPGRMLSWPRHRLWCWWADFWHCQVRFSWLEFCSKMSPWLVTHVPSAFVFSRLTRFFTSKVSVKFPGYCFVWPMLISSLRCSILGKCPQIVLCTTHACTSTLLSLMFSF